METTESGYVPGGFSPRDFEFLLSLTPRAGWSRIGGNRWDYHHSQGHLTLYLAPPQFEAGELEVYLTSPRVGLVSRVFRMVKEAGFSPCLRGTRKFSFDDSVDVSITISFHVEEWGRLYLLLHSLLSLLRNGRGRH